jgi:hypothetical protein
MALSLKCYLCGSELEKYSNEVQNNQVVQNIECKKGHKYSIDDTSLTRLAQLSRRIRTAAQATVEQDNAAGKTSLFAGNSLLDLV